MPTVSGKDVFAIDWTNLEAVKSLADKLGKGMSVIKYPDRPNYNIKHTSHTNIKAGYDVVYETGV